LQHITDFSKEQAYVERDPPAVWLAEVAGARTVVQVPMPKENRLVGAIAIYRQEVRPVLAAMGASSYPVNEAIAPTVVCQAYSLLSVMLG
jgi:hypothetical protein